MQTCSSRKYPFIPWTFVGYSEWESEDKLEFPNGGGRFKPKISPWRRGRTIPQPRGGWIFSAASHYKFNPLNSIFAFMKLKMTDESVETCFVLKTTDVNFFL